MGILNRTYEELKINWLKVGDEIYSLRMGSNKYDITTVTQIKKITNKGPKDVSKIPWNDISKNSEQVNAIIYFDKMPYSNNTSWLFVERLIRKVKD